MSKKTRRPTPPRPWQPLRRAINVALDGGELWGNDRYTVSKREIRSTVDPDGPTMTVLSIHNHARSAVGAHDWRHFQLIKNELCGAEREAVELYPAESRLVDTANEFWLWVLPAGMQFPFGFDERRVYSHVEDDLDAFRSDLEAAGKDNPEQIIERVRQKSKQRPLTTKETR